MVWLSDVEAPTTQTVRTVKLGASKKGLILCTDEYDVFLFSSHRMTKFLKEALEVWYKNPDHWGKELIVIPSKALKEGFEIGHRDITQWWFDPASVSYVSGEWVEEDNTTNPFLSDLESPPSIPTNPLLPALEQGTSPRGKRKS